MTADELAETYIGALCVWREARGEAVSGKRAVWCVIRNRKVIGRWGNSITAVVTAKWQFSSFNPADSNTLKFPDPNDQSWFECVQIVTERREDSTDGATHYFSDSIEPPKWAASMEFKVKIGHHSFYKEG